MKVKRVVIFGWAESAHVSRWARGLSERGIRVKVISLGEKPIPDIETVNVAPVGKIAYFRCAGRAAREAKAFNPDIVHVHYAAGFGVWMLRTGFTPSVVSVWGSDIEHRSKNPFLRRIIKRTLTKSDAITATSENLREGVLKVAPSTEAKVTVIPFGVELPQSISDPPSLPPLRLCSLKKHELIYGPDILLKALALVKEKLPDVQLSLASFGTQTEFLKKMIAELGLGENVRITGWLDNRNIPEFVAQHHVVMMPSLREAFGVAALDAYAAGRPVIASRVGGIPEVVIDGKTGILVPPGEVPPLADAILSLAENPAKITEMGRAGYQFTRENYTWDRSLDMMIDLYERLVNEKK
ncbi:MAG TPA: glycosyltransferase family 4 protein [candidate division Zixibacteria bacterium]|nr:glycosyltransferase family 4 protein [candidate division Zixibacteria bacterium]